MLFFANSSIIPSLLQDYYAVMSSLPEDDEPVHFGLPANIERSRQRINSTRVIHQLKGNIRRGISTTVLLF